MGVCDLTRQAMIKHGLAGDQASGNFWVLDEQGLVTAARSNLQKHVRVFARVQEHELKHDGDSLLEVVRRVKPTGTTPALYAFGSPSASGLLSSCTFLANHTIRGCHVTLVLLL